MATTDMTPTPPQAGERADRYVVLKASGSRFAYVHDTQVGRTVRRYDILRGYDKGNGWDRADAHARRLNELDVAIAALDSGGAGEVGCG